ncbi:MAG: SxtJ family membrane protein [Limisphaerales bacterium]
MPKKWFHLPLKPTPRVLRQFAAAWLVFFLAVAAQQMFLRNRVTAACALGTIALIGLVGLVKPSTVRWLFVGASIVAFPIGWVMTQVVLAVMFYVVLTPLALVFRWRGRDELQLRRRPEQTSFWIARRPERDVKRYLKQF